MVATWKKIAFEDDVITKALISDKGDLIVGLMDNFPAVFGVGSNDQVLTADSGEAAGMKWATPSTGGPTIAYKAYDEAVNNSTTFQDDDDLVLALVANGIYLVEITLLMYTTTTTPDIKFQWTYPVGCTIYWGVIARDTAAAAGIHWEPTSSTGVSPTGLLAGTNFWYTGLAAGTNCGAVYRAIVINGANAGNLQLQWAQLVGTAEDTKLLAGSCLLAWKLN